MARDRLGLQIEQIVEHGDDAFARRRSESAVKPRRSDDQITAAIDIAAAAPDLPGQHPRPRLRAEIGAAARFRRSGAGCACRRSPRAARTEASDRRSRLPVSRRPVRRHRPSLCAPKPNGLPTGNARYSVPPRALSSCSTEKSSARRVRSSAADRLAAVARPPYRIVG